MNLKNIQPGSLHKGAILKILQHIPGLAWSSTEHSQFDFEACSSSISLMSYCPSDTLLGDVITTPTIASLTAIICTTLGDDIWREDLTTIQFEEEIASLCGHDSATLSPSCTAANQLALRCLVQETPSGILCDVQSHIVKHESVAASWISGAVLQLASPSNGLYITLEDIRKTAILNDGLGQVPTKAIALENTISGIIVPLHEIRRISKWAQQHDIRIHMDGARLWHAAAQLKGPNLKDYSELCDTVALDFSKIIGAPGGTMLVGDRSTIALARRLRKQMGTIGQLGLLAAAAEGAFAEQFGLGFPNGNNIIRDVHRLSAEVANMWTCRDERLTKPVQTNMVWLDLSTIGLTRREFDERAAQFQIQTDGPRLVLHHQISQEALRRLSMLFDDLLSL